MQGRAVQQGMVEEVAGIKDMLFILRRILLVRVYEYWQRLLILYFRMKRQTCLRIPVTLLRS